MSDEKQQMAPVASLEEKIGLPPEDLELVHRACASIADAQNDLGAEYERHMNEAMRLKNQIDQSRAEYRALVDVLAKKHVRQRPGRFDFRPELGAFVRTRSNHGSQGEER